MKDYNYYKTIADICNAANDVYKKFNVEESIPLNKISLDNETNEGDSFILKSKENKYLMVETSSNFSRWVGSRIMLNDINKVDGNFAKYLHDYEQEDHNGNWHRLFVFDYIEGEKVQDYLLKVCEEDAYNLGKELGETLNKVHLIVVDWLKHHVSNWHDKYKWIQKSIIEDNVSNNILDKAFKYYKENKDIINNRYSSSEYYNKIDGKYVFDENGKHIIEKVLSFIFKDITLENLVVSNKKVYIRCPINISIGDPFYDFKYLSLIALENKYFAKGIVDGYFKDNVSKDFFKMLKYYTSELIIKEYNKSLDEDIINKIYDLYNDFKLEVPNWYNQTNR